MAGKFLYNASLLALLFAAPAGAQTTLTSCCSTDADCEAKIDADMQEYLSTYDKSIICVPDCVGVHCKMFGTCQDCRGCYNTCEGAAYYIATHPGTPSSGITFCPDAGYTEYEADCLSHPTPAPVMGEAITGSPTGAPVGDDSSSSTSTSSTFEFI